MKSDMGRKELNFKELNAKVVLQDSKIRTMKYSHDSEVDRVSKDISVLRSGLGRLGTKDPVDNHEITCLTPRIIRSCTTYRILFLLHLPEILSRTHPRSL